MISPVRQGVPTTLRRIVFSFDPFTLNIRLVHRLPPAKAITKPLYSSHKQAFPPITVIHYD